MDRKCGTCKIQDSKYTCPGCGIRSCSLECVKSHKSGIDACDGVRKKSTYIPLEQFTDDDFEKDFAFMSSAFDTLGSISRDKLRKITCKGENALKIPFSVRELINANRLRGCRYLVLPPHFQRSKTNSSKLIYKRNRILWKVEWVFPHAENLTIVEGALDELTRLGDHLEGLIAQDSKRKMEEEDKDLIELHPFIQYEALGLGGFKALLKIEGIQKDSNCSRFEELEWKKSLRANLQGKTVIEHPIIYLVLNQHVSSYTCKDAYDPSLWVKGLEPPKTLSNSSPQDQKTLGLLAGHDSDSDQEASPMPKPAVVQKESAPSGLLLVQYSDSE